MSGKINIIDTKNNDYENFKYLDFIGGKKNEIGNVLGDVEGFMEENGISRYELYMLLEHGINEEDALKALAMIKKKEGKRDIDILMRNGIYEDVALKILVEINKKENYEDKLKILMKYKNNKNNKVNESEASKILTEIKNEKERKERYELEKLDYLINLGIDEDEANKLIKRIYKLSEVNKDVLDSFESFTGIDEDDKVLEIIDEVNKAEKRQDKINVLGKYGIRNYTIRGEDKNAVLDAIEEDENNKFSAERHGKPEKYYSDVFPEYFRDTLSLYEKEELARKIDYVQKNVICDENVKIRVNPGVIRGLRSLLGVHDFKGGAYFGNTIFLSAVPDIDNLVLLNHENTHGYQQRELGSKKLQKLAPGAPKLRGFIRRCAESFVKGPILWKFDHKDEKFDIEVLTTSVRTENEAYTNQGNIGYPKLRRKKEYKRYRGEAVEAQLIDRVAKHNYGLEIESQNLDGRLNSIINKISKIMDNNFNSPEGEDQEIYLNLKETINNIGNKLLQLNEENKKGGYNIEKRDNLIDKYKNIITDMLVFVWEFYSLYFEGNVIEKEGETKLNKGKIIGKHKVLKLSNSQKELDLMQEIGDIRQELLNMKYNLDKNGEINRPNTENNGGRFKRWTFNMVDKNVDIVCVIRLLEDKLEELNLFEKNGNKIDQFKASANLKKNIELYQNEIANENLSYMLEDEFTDSNLIEKTIRQLNQKCYDNEAAATDIWLEKNGHYENALKMSEDTAKSEGIDEENGERKRKLDETKKEKKEKTPVVPMNFQK